MLSFEKYRRQMIDVTITLLPLLAMAWYYYGPRVLILAAISVLSAVAADYICLLMQGKRRWEKYDFSAAIAGLTFVLMPPASAPYWLAVFGAVFAVAVVRHPFGGCYNTMFNPGITAYAFAVLCWNNLVTKYPAAMTELPLTASVDVPLCNSPAYQLMLGGSNNLQWLDALLGNFYGPMGTTCIAVLLCCGVYLIFRKTIMWQVPVASLAIVAAAAWFFPRINGSRMVSVLMELTSGVMLFAILFAVSLDNGEIRTASGKWMYGVILGGFIVLFRQLSNIEVVTPFVIIIMNTIDHRCDAYAGRIFTGFRYAGKGLGRLWKLCMGKSGKTGGNNNRLVSVNSGEERP